MSAFGASSIGCLPPAQSTFSGWTTSPLLRHNHLAPASTLGYLWPAELRAGARLASRIQAKISRGTQDTPSADELRYTCQLP